MLADEYRKNAKYLIAGLVVLVMAAGLFSGASAATPRESHGAARNMVFWLHYDPTSPTVNGQATQLTFNTSMYFQKSNYTIDGDKNLAMDFYLNPPLVADVTVKGTITVGFWGNYSGANNAFSVPITIYERNNLGNENWTSTTSTFNYAPASAPQYYSFAINNFQHTFAAGSTIRVNIQVTGGNNIYKAVYIDTTTNNSRIIFPCEDWMEVASINTFDYQGNPQGGFQMSSNNTTVIMRSTVNAPFGGYDIRWANITMVGPTGSTILNNVTMTKVSGTPVSFANTYETRWNYTGASPGRYNLTVWAVDNNGYYYAFYFLNFNYGNYSVYNTSFFFIGTPRFVNVQALDSTGVPLQGAEVQATILDNITDLNFTNANGLTNISMQPGPYFFRVWWNGMMVADEQVNVTDNVSEAAPVVIYCWVYYPVFEAVDSHDIPLVDAAVYMTYPNGTSTILPHHTNASGMFSLSQAARGPYVISVVWGGLEVNRSIVQVQGNVTYTIVGDVYYLTVRAIDPHGAPILNAQMVITDNATLIVADSKLSDSNGSAIFRLPRHFYDIRVYWYEAVIYEGWHEPLVADRELTITCGIYYFTITALDSRNVPLENALGVVSIAANSKVMDSRLSGVDGKITVRMPVGTYNITFYWQDVKVYDGANIPVSADSSYNALCSVYYIGIETRDSHGLPVENAQIQVNSHESGRLYDVRTTGAQGNVTSRLPATDVSVTARWQDILVNTTQSYIVSGDGTLVLHCSVYYLGITAVDSLGAPVQSATVKVSFASGGKLLDVKVTGYDGTTLSRLPASDLTFLGYWQDVLVNQTDIYTLTGDANITLNCRIYYLDILCVDSKDRPIDDAYVSVSLSGGRLMESPRTNESGLVRARVPVSSVNVSVTWLNVPVADVAGHPVEDNHLLTVKCSVYYLDVVITDSQDKTVSNAQVSFFHKAEGKRMDTRITTGAGNATFRLPAEMYKVTVTWQDQLVSPDTEFRISQDGTLTVKCLIYYLTVKPVDSQNKLLDNATVVFRQDATGNVLETKVTGADGTVVARLPFGKHSVYVGWKDVSINETLAYELTADSALTISCRVYYLTVVPSDVAGIPLSNAQLTMFPKGRPEAAAALVTDANGRAIFRLPAQTYDFTVRWKDVEVRSQTNYNLVADATLPTSCRVYYLTVKISDKEGKGIEGVTMTVFTTRNGLAVDVADSFITNASSRGIFRLPIGDYRIVARLKTTYQMTSVDMTKSKAVSLQGSSDVKMVFSEYPLPIYTTNAFFAAILFIFVVIAMVGTMFYIYKRFAKHPPEGPTAGMFGGAATAQSGHESPGEETDEPASGETEDDEKSAEDDELAPEPQKTGAEETEGKEDGKAPSKNEGEPETDKDEGEPAANKKDGETKNDDLDSIINNLGDK